MADSRPNRRETGGQKNSGATQGVMLQAVLQTIEIGEALLPTLMTRLHIDMPRPRQDPSLGPPVARQLQGARGAHGVVIVGADHLAWEWQQISGNRRKIAQRRRAGRPFDIRRRHQYRPAHPPQKPYPPTGRPMATRNAPPPTGKQT